MPKITVKACVAVHLTEQKDIPFTTIKSPLYVHELEKAMNLNHNYANKLQFV
jgi:hypothetical protein